MSCPWDDYVPATMRFCEKVECAWITTPANTVSNLAYFIVAIWLYRVVRRENNNYYLMLPLAALVTGIGSTFFHASTTYVGEVTDLCGMFLFSSFWVVHNLGRMYNIQPNTRIILSLALALAATIEMVISHAGGVISFTIQVTFAVLLELYEIRKSPTAFYFGKYKHLTLLAGFFAFSFAAWVLDVTHTLCDPENHWFQGHAVWHIANSPCFYFLYRHMTREEEKVPSVGDRHIGIEAR